MAKQIKLPENPTPEQVEKLKKPLVKAILEEFYTDGIDDLTVQEGSGNTIVTGKFLDRRNVGGKTDNRVFEYEVTRSGTNYTVNYKPIAGNFGEPGTFQDDEDLMIEFARTRKKVTLEFAAEGVELEDFMDKHREAVTEALAEELIGLGFAEFVEEVSSEPDWAKVEPGSWNS